MLIELPEEIEPALKAQALAQGLSIASYVREVVERDLGLQAETQSPRVPFKTGRGSCAAYGQAPSTDEIDSNRAEIFRGFGEGN